MLNLMYITNRPSVAKIAEDAGVDRIFLDMEYIGKDKRQAGLNTVKSHHTIEDIKRIRDLITKSEILVRINPIHDESNNYISSEEEINQAINAGADIIMLPMFRRVDEVNRFVKAINGKCKTMLLVETPEAVDIIDDVCNLPEVNEIHIGLNDLHLALHRKFMFELLADGTVEKICNVAQNSGKKYGFGGIARIGYGMLQAEYIIREHYRLHSSAAILSRSFCNADTIIEERVIEQLFQNELKKIRETEIEASRMSFEELENNRKTVVQLVTSITREL